MTHDNDTAPVFRGLCPAPFLDVAAFPPKGGYIPGRVCSKVYAGLTCCLPCPATDWIYPQSFKTWYKVAQGLSAVGLAICIFLCISWTLLPNERSKSHYLGICLVISIMLECLAFVIPLGASHKPCYNDITPNDMTSNLTCAFSGASLVLGGLSTTAWVALRSLSMHLQICWDVVPGVKFFYLASGLGWGFPLIIFVICMCLTGVSYRFGDTCHLNANRSMGDFWAPMLAVAGIAALLQFATLLYCVKVYLKNIWSDQNEHSHGSAGLPSFTSSRTRSAKVVYQRVKKVLWLQWRSVTIVLLLLADVIFFSIIWIELDTAITNIGDGHTDHIMAFLACILINPSIKQRPKCFSLGQQVLVNEQACIALLMMLSLTGIQTGLLLTRSSLFKGWGEIFRDKFGRKKEFVSLDAKRYSADPRGNIPLNPINTPKRVESANTADTYSSRDQNSPYVAGHQFEPNYDRTYRQPRMSFSTPRPAPSTPPPHSRPAWDAAESFARPSTAGPTYGTTYSPISPPRLSNDHLHNRF